jgi:hypothetical protein
VRAARAWHGVLATVVILALAIQIGIALDAPALPAGHAVGTLRGTNAVGRVVRVLSFFTIQSNIISAVVATQLAIRPDRDGRSWRVLRLAGLFGITVTGIVYSTVLAKVHEPHGWAETSTNFVFHYLTPAGIVLGWALFGPRPRIDRRATLALAWPCLWAGWTLVHGAITGWYPYPFVDVDSHGYAVVLVNSAAVVVVLGVVTAVFAWGDRALPPAPNTDHQT